jgi:DNA-nicking Smr family endonuclease
MRKPSAGIVDINIHGMNMLQAGHLIDTTLRNVKTDVYKLRIIHGSNNGTILRDMVRKNYTVHPKVLRIETVTNPGETLLVLREY